MTDEPPDVVLAKRLLDSVRADGFTFHRVAEGPDGALVGSRETDTWTDTVYLAGFSRNCFATRERTTSLIIPGCSLVTQRVTGNAAIVLFTVLGWETGPTPPAAPRP